VTVERTDGDSLLALLAALANPQRMRVVAALTRGRSHVSGLARDVGMSRPLLYLHLQKLEAAGIVRGALELSDDGKAMKYYELVPFDLRITPELITNLVESLPVTGKPEEEA
jgi:predicted transcriptional regulator